MFIIINMTDMNPQTVLDNGPGSANHECYPCWTTYYHMKNQCTLEELGGSSWDEPKIQYLLWWAAGS